MALTLFRSYALLIVLCIFMIFIDDSAQAEVEIPQGCKVVFSGDNLVILPKGYKISIPDVSEANIPSSRLDVSDPHNTFVYPPKYWIVTLPDGFKFLRSYSSTADGRRIDAPSVNDIKYNTSGECQVNLKDGWSVQPTSRIQSGTSEGSEDVIVYGYPGPEFVNLEDGWNSAPVRAIYNVNLEDGWNSGTSEGSEGYSSDEY